jgi:hypothetical protein
MSRGRSSNTFDGAIVELSALILPVLPAMGGAIEELAGVVYALSLCTGAVVWAAAIIVRKPNEAASVVCRILWCIMT